MPDNLLRAINAETSLLAGISRLLVIFFFALFFPNARTMEGREALKLLQVLKFCRHKGI